MKTMCLQVSLILLLGQLYSAPLFAAQFNLTPSLVVSEEYTDNLFLDSEDKEDDFITSAGMRLSADVLWQTAGLNLTYTPTYQFYADNSDLDSWRHGASFSAYKEYKRTRFSISSSVLYSRNPGDSSDDEDLREGTPPSISTDPDRRGREKYLENVNVASVTHQFGADDAVNGGLRYRILRDYGLPSDEENDYDIWEPFMGFDYWFNVRWGIQMNGVYSNRDYKNDDDREEYNGSARLRRRFTRHLNGFVEYEHTYLDFAEETDTDSDYNVYAPSAGIQYQFERNANVLIGLGYYYQEFSENDQDSESGFFVNADIFRTWPFRRGFLATYPRVTSIATIPTTMKTTLTSISMLALGFATRPRGGWT